MELTIPIHNNLRLNEPMNLNHYITDIISMMTQDSLDDNLSKKSLDFHDDKSI